jgi:hypothetical protein
LRSVRRADQRRETIGHESEIGIRTVAIDSGRLFVQATSGQLIWQSWVSAEGRHGHPHPTDDAGNGPEKTSSILGTNQDAGTATSNVQRLLRQSVRDLVQLAGHTEIVVEVQNGCMAHRTTGREIGSSVLLD